MRIAVVGAGAIGGWLGVKLAAAGNPVSVLARGATLAALQNGSWCLKSAASEIEARVTASEDPGALGKHELVILAVKGPAIATVASAAAQLLGAEGILLPAINGVPWWFTTIASGRLDARPLASIDPDGAIARQLPVTRIIGAVAHVSAAVEAPGLVRQVGGNGLIIGEPGGGASTRVSEVASVLGAAGIDVTMSSAIRNDIWYKLWGNMTINPIAALTGATADRILDEPLAESLICEVMEEARRIGEEIGCVIAEDAKARNAVTRKLGTFRPSMLQDAEAGRPMEVAALLEAPREIGGILGLSTPALDGLLGLMRLKAAQFT